MNAKRAVFLSCLLAASACSPSEDPDENRQELSAENESGSIYLDADQMIVMERKANKGDVDAMKAIAAHYIFAASSPEKAIPWLEMAVNHDSAAAMRGLAILLAEKGGEVNCRRAEELFTRGLRISSNPAERKKLGTSYENFRNGSGAGMCHAMAQPAITGSPFRRRGQ